MSKPRKVPVIAVVFMDPATASRWIDDPETEAQPAECVAVGLLAHEDEDVLRVALLTSAAGDFGDVLAIPKSIIIKRKKLTYVEI